MVRSGLRVPRAQILHVQAAHDPHERLGESILPRQRYSETKGMIVWHIDSEASASDGKGIFCLACAMILHPRWLTGLPRDLNECIYEIYGITSICRAINQQFHALNLNFLAGACLHDGLVAHAGYEKLRLFGFNVHGSIDGGSNFIVYATLALNKNAELVCWLQTACRGLWPSTCFTRRYGLWGCPYRAGLAGS